VFLAKMHENAKAHRSAAEHHGKGDHTKGKEHANAAKQHSQPAFLAHSEKGHSRRARRHVSKVP
jgi:hypothetical protein